MGIDTRKVRVVKTKDTAAARQQAIKNLHKATNVIRASNAFANASKKPAQNRVVRQEQNFKKT
jgi:hypothetical protein